MKTPRIESRRRLQRASLPSAVVRVDARYGALPERVFNAWLDPDVARQWLFATATRPLAHVAIDARAGGSFRFVERQGGAGVNRGVSRNSEGFINGGSPIHRHVKSVSSDA